MIPKIVDIDMLSFEDYVYNQVVSSTTNPVVLVKKYLLATLAAILEGPFHLATS